jgi:hypothetical protein
MSKIFVIAGNRQQADDWIKTNLDKRSKAGETTLSWSDYVVVSGPDKLRGWNEPHGVFIGTWRERKDMEDIFQTLLVCHSISGNSHRVINQLWGEWKDSNPKFVGLGFHPSMVIIKKNGTWNIHDTNPLPYASRVASITTGLPPDTFKDVCLKINGGMV